jgi:hypothetical protein
VSHAGSVLLLETIRATRLDRQLSAALAPWCKPLARHDPAKVLLDLAVALALVGDCLADVALLRAGPQLFGPVASDPTVSRTVDTLAADQRALTAIATAWATARARAWALAGTGAGTPTSIPGGRWSWICEATSKVTLRVLGHNVGARRLYERCGFVPEGVLRGEFLLEGRYVDDVLMACDLVAPVP